MTKKKSSRTQAKRNGAPPSKSGREADLAHVEDMRANRLFGVRAHGGSLAGVLPAALDCASNTSKVVAVQTYSDAPSEGRQERNQTLRTLISTGRATHKLGPIPLLALLYEYMHDSGDERADVVDTLIAWPRLDEKKRMEILRDVRALLGKSATKRKDLALRLIATAKKTRRMIQDGDERFPRWATTQILAWKGVVEDLGGHVPDRAELIRLIEQKLANPKRKLDDEGLAAAAFDACGLSGRRIVASAADDRVRPSRPKKIRTTG